MTDSGHSALFERNAAEHFLATHWQRSPCFLPAALTALPPAPPWRELIRQQEVESRRITTLGDGRFALEHGPFDDDDPALPWTVLISDAQFHVPALDALLQAVDFLPRWRLDDVMVSVASSGASVGPHVDAYDVFLVQAAGRRRWQIGAVDSATPDPRGEDLRLVEPFAAVKTVVAEPGDVLYLPPGVPHHGVALESCMTYSIGLRAPRLLDLAAVLLDGLSREARMQDPARPVADHPLLLDRASVMTVREQLRSLLDLTPDAVADALGRLVTEPKEWLLTFPQPGTGMASAGTGVKAQRGARFALDEDSDPPKLFANGEAHALDGACTDFARRLTRDRLVPITAANQPPAVAALIDRLLEDAAVYWSDEV